jgi:hypothetical protein
MPERTTVMTTVYQRHTVQEWKPGMFERPCGGCTVCCKVASVPEIGKPANAWCANCDKGKGCRIYERRPQACRDFYCLWKVMPDFPEELRPDKCKVLWQLTEDGEVAVATTEYPQALQTRRQETLLRNFHCLGIAVVVRSSRGADRANVVGFR